MRRKHLTPLAIALGTFAPGAVAHAVPPSSTDFVIWYYSTDEDGGRGRRMTQQDLQQFVNQARCECGQKIEATVNLNNSSSGMAYDQSRIRTFAGSMCDVGQVGISTQNQPCVLLEDQLPNYYTKNPSMLFEPIWLSTGVSSTDSQSINTAVPLGTCESGRGEGGIWICVEDGMQTDCQVNEFIIKGTTNMNSQGSSGSTGTTGTTGTPTSAGGIVFDYDPPISYPTQFTASEGDGAVVLEWDFETQPEAAGYRILCANADGSPVDGKGVSRPNITAENNGTLYFTASNLCPDGPFGQGSGVGTTDGGGSDGGGTDDGGSGTGSATSGDFGTTGIGLLPDDGWAHGVLTGTTSGTGGETGASTSDTGTGSDGTGRFATGTSTGGSDTSGVTVPDGIDPAAAAAIQSLDWAYVCSDHLPSTTKRGRVDGLENGQDYIFLVVAYDTAGNPVVASEDLIIATPRETTDLWERCEQQGGVCGDGGFCNCTTGEDGPSPGSAWWALALLGLRRRRRR